MSKREKRLQTVKNDYKEDKPRKRLLPFGEHEPLTPENLKDDKFIKHIQNHLQPGQVVVCKICGKTVREILDE